MPKRKSAVKPSTPDSFHIPTQRIAPSDHGSIGFYSRPEFMRLACLGPVKFWEIERKEYRLPESERTFPKRYAITEGKFGYRRDEVHAWILSRPVVGMGPALASPSPGRPRKRPLITTERSNKNSSD